MGITTFERLGVGDFRLCEFLEVSAFDFRQILPARGIAQRSGMGCGVGKGQTTCAQQHFEFRQHACCFRLPAPAGRGGWLGKQRRE